MWGTAHFSPKADEPFYILGFFVCFLVSLFFNKDPSRFPQRPWREPVPKGPSFRVAAAGAPKLLTLRAHSAATQGSKPARERTLGNVGSPRAWSRLRSNCGERKTDAWQRLCGHCSFSSSQPSTDCGKENYNAQKAAVLRQLKGQFRMQHSCPPSRPPVSPGRL